MSFHRILVALDADTSSTGALSYAASLAKELGAELKVLHVWQAPGYTLGIRALVAEEELLGASTAAEQRFLDEHLADARAHVPEVTGILRRGEAAPEILEEISEAKPDLVVMGSHGRAGVPRAVIGSVAAEVVRSSPVPVLLFGPTYSRPCAGHGEATDGRLLPR